MKALRSVDTDEDQVFLLPRLSHRLEDIERRPGAPVVRRHETSHTVAVPEESQVGTTRTVFVEVQGDHLQALGRARDPVSAIAELVWNGLDEDATDVRVQLVSNNLDGLETIRVIDNGNGMPYDEGVRAFGSLGGSSKRQRVRTPGGRLRHGKLGKGRFRAFALGDRIEWFSKYLDGTKLKTFTVTGRRDQPGRFEFTAPQPATGTTGVSVEITNLDHKFARLEHQGAIDGITKQFALYLRQYPEIKLWYDGSRVDPATVEDFVADYPLKSIPLKDGRMVDAALTVIEWKIPTERALFLCDENGFTLHEAPAGIHASGFSFTAYLKCAYLRELDESNKLVLEELDPDIKSILDAAKTVLREHFRKRTAEKAVEVVEEWKRDDVYPFVGAAVTPLDIVERQVFDVTAMQVHTYLPNFDDADAKQKRFTFRLLKEALSNNPGSLQEIFLAVLDLPKEKADDLAKLLHETSLEAILNASKMIAGRLAFLAGLRALVFEPDLKKVVRERTQLHRLVAEHTWIFGEEFNISADDEELTTVLKRHIDPAKLELLGSDPVLREDGSKGVLDLMLSRSVPQNNAAKREHLVVELKRPSVPVNQEGVGQIKSYAEAIAQDARFRDTDTRWVFWVLSTDLQTSVRRDANQEGLPPGLLSRPQGEAYSIWTKTWGEIIQENEARLKFVQDRLQLRVTEGAGLAYLREAYAKYLPVEAGGPPSQKRQGASGPAKAPRPKKRSGKKAR
jgi:hypothetical protein